MIQTHYHQACLCGQTYTGQKPHCPIHDPEPKSTTTFTIGSPVVVPSSEPQPTDHTLELFGNPEELDQKPICQPQQNGQTPEAERQKILHRKKVLGKHAGMSSDEAEVVFSYIGSLESQIATLQSEKEAAVQGLEKLLPLVDWQTRIYVSGELHDEAVERHEWLTKLIKCLSYSK